MKRVQSACLFQTLVFAQKEDCGLSKVEQLKLNRSEAERYRAGLDAAKTRYQMDEISEQPDGSVLIRVRKQYNDRTDVSEYFA